VAINYTNTGININGKEAKKLSNFLIDTDITKQQVLSSIKNIKNSLKLVKKYKK